jgi:hypothetical protein
MSTENGNTTKYRLEQVEKCCENNKKEVEKIKFVFDRKNDIMELNVMKSKLDSIIKTQRMIMATAIGALLAVVADILYKLIA